MHWRLLPLIVDALNNEMLAVVAYAKEACTILAMLFYLHSGHIRLWIIYYQLFNFCFRLCKESDGRPVVSPLVKEPAQV